MIFPLPNSCVLSVLATIVCVAFSVSLVSAIPVNRPSDNIEYKKYCSNILTDTINQICGGRTKSLADIFPDSFGQRSKRFIPDETFYSAIQGGPVHICCQNPCSYHELYRYCAYVDDT